VKFGSGAEELRKAASLIPGYGPPDIAFPSAFVGRWFVQARVVEVKTPLGDERVAPAQLKAARELLAAEQLLRYEARFAEVEGGASGKIFGIDTSDSGASSPFYLRAYGGGLVILDRAFNAKSRAAAQPGAPPSHEITARWQPTNPNVLTVVSSSGSAVETKVTKRSFQQPFDGAFGTSESARVVEVGSEGESSTMPKRTERVQTKYKWDATGGGEALQIEAIELAQTFDASESDSADPAGATPVLTVKTRLLFTRQRPEDQNFP
jgi:hypothetical protein